jgi:hypothetical protein
MNGTISIVACIETLVDIALSPASPTIYPLIELLEKEQVRLYICPFQLMSVYSQIFIDHPYDREIARQSIEHLSEQGNVLSSHSPYDELIQSIDIFESSLSQFPVDELDLDYNHLLAPRTLIFARQISASALVSNDLNIFDQLKQSLLDENSSQLPIIDIPGLIRTVNNRNRKKIPNTSNDQIQERKGPETIQVFTRDRLRKIQLPAGSVVLDFAFELHTAIGQQCVGATINGTENRPINTPLKNEDIIDITRDAAGYDGYLEDIATTDLAKRKSRRHDRDKRIKQGRITVKEALSNKKTPLTSIQNQIKQASGLTTEEFLVRITTNRISRTELDIAIQRIEEIRKGKTLIHTEGIDVNSDEIRVKRARCCEALPGDEISGIISADRESIALHRTSCLQLNSVRKSLHPSRVVDQLSWACSNCKADISITLQDQPDTVRPILNLVYENGIDYDFRELIMNNDGSATIRLILKIYSRPKIDNIIRSIEHHSGVRTVKINSLDDFS